MQHMAILPWFIGMDRDVCGGHRIRHYGLFVSSNRTANLARAREMLGAALRVVEPEEHKAPAADEPRVLPCPCPRCGGRMIVIEVFARRTPSRDFVPWRFSDHRVQLDVGVFEGDGGLYREQSEQRS